MAVELYPDNNANSTGISPRISFSHDFCLSDIVPTEQHPFRNSSIDFDFCTRKSFDRDSSPADELFSDGKLLPSEIKKKTPAKQNLVRSSPDENSSSKTEKIVIKESNSETEDKQTNTSSSSSKSFWKFKRSSSLNCVSGYGRSLCPLPLLSRSNSTGSTPNSIKRVPLTRDGSKKQGFIKSNSSSSSSSNFQKPPLKKNYGNGVRVNPVLNVPSGNLFGLGSIFYNGKEKNSKKK